MSSLVRLSVWLAILCFPAGMLGQLLLCSHRRRRRLLQIARWLWTLGAVAFLGHAATAFHFEYRWSHEIAWRETARQSAEVTGWRSGAGLYLNYLFGSLWLTDAVWWWTHPTSYFRKPRGAVIGLQSFLLFMILNGAVVFATGPVRWLGTVVLGLTVAMLVRYWNWPTSPTSGSSRTDIAGR